MSNTPAVGRIVHYVSHGSPVREDGTQEYTRACRAAIITLVHDRETSLVALHAFPPGGQFDKQGVAYDEGEDPMVEDTELCDGLYYEGGSWHWPART